MGLVAAAKCLAFTWALRIGELEQTKLGFPPFPLNQFILELQITITNYSYKSHTVLCIHIHTVQRYFQGLLFISYLSAICKVKAAYKRVSFGSKGLSAYPLSCF